MEGIIVWKFYLLFDKDGGYVAKSSSSSSASSVTSSSGTVSGGWKGTIITFLNTYLVPITIFLLVLTAVFCIALAFFIMKTDDPGKQKEYKTRMIQIACTIVICLFLVWILYWILGSTEISKFLDNTKSDILSGFSQSKTGSK